MNEPKHTLIRAERIKAIREQANSNKSVRWSDLKWLISEIEGLSIDAAKLTEELKALRAIGNDDIRNKKGGIND
jgi:hypothetical protein